MTRPDKKPPTPLQKTIARQASKREQPKYQRLNAAAYRAATRAASMGPSAGRVTAAEQRAIHRQVKATRLITTPAEAQGLKKILRRKARRS